MGCQIREVWGVKVEVEVEVVRGERRRRRRTLRVVTARHRRRADVVVLLARRADALHAHLAVEPVHLEALVLQQLVAARHLGDVADALDAEPLDVEGVHRVREPVPFTKMFSYVLRATAAHEGGVGTLGAGHITWTHTG